MTDNHWKALGYTVGHCPRDSVDDCAQLLREVTECIDASSTPDYSHCRPGPSQHWGRCESYDEEVLWNHPTMSVLSGQRFDLEHKVEAVVKDSHLWGPLDCQSALSVLAQQTKGLTSADTFERDMSKRCTAGSAASYFCFFQNDVIDNTLMDYPLNWQTSIWSQLGACHVFEQDEDDGPPGECGEPIPDAYIYREEDVKFLVMEYCPTTSDLTMPGVLCEPVYGPVSTAPMFYKVGYFNPDTMMETPPDCLPPVDPMP